MKPDRHRERWERQSSVREQKRIDRDMAFAVESREMDEEVSRRIGVVFDMCNNMKVKSTDLKPGDVVVFADIRDEVVSVDVDDKVVRVTVQRRFTDGRKEQPVDTFFTCGAKSEQEIVRA